MTGQKIAGKPINLSQLQDELTTAQVDVGLGLGMSDDLVYRNVSGDPGTGGLPMAVPSDFLLAQQATVDQTISSHVAMRDKTDAEYAVEFQDPNTTVQRKQEIRDITAGLLPREQVPM